MSDSDPISESTLVTWYNKQVETESVALQRLWDQYFHRMVPLARRKLEGVRRGDRDEEDVAISAFQSFCHGLRRGKFVQAPDPDDINEDNLWPLLVRLTLNKAINEVRRQTAQKRGGRDEKLPGGSAHELLDQFASAEGNPQLVAIAEESMRRLMTALDQSGDSDLRNIVVATFEGESLRSIAERLNCSPRTVQRKLRTARALWETAAI